LALRVAASCISCFEGKVGWRHSCVTAVACFGAVRRSESAARRGGAQVRDANALAWIRGKRGGGLPGYSTAGAEGYECRESPRTRPGSPRDRAREPAGGPRAPDSQRRPPLRW